MKKKIILLVILLVIMLVAIFIIYNNMLKSKSTQVNDESSIKIVEEKVNTVTFTELKDEDGNMIPVPSGYQISKYEGERKVNTGLVIYELFEGETVLPENEPIDIAKETRNQFVWVPVKYVVGLKENYLDSNGNKAMAIKENSNYKGLLYRFEGVESLLINEEENYLEPVILEKDISIIKEELQKNYNNMIESVIKYGGFYVGRYETSYTDGKIKVVANAYPADMYNGEIKDWYELYEMQKKLSTESLQSTMIWGSQWDAMLNWALKGNDAKKVNKIGNATYTNTYYSSAQKTGLTSTDKINNIYDLEGNVCEWTLESKDKIYRVYRGGTYYPTNPASGRDSYFPDSQNNEGGSRISIYIK